MCITPSRITVNERTQLVACRYCWQCRANRVNDLVGRCIAEKLYSTKTYAVTLTYAGETPNAATLVYKDVQDFMKRLRWHGYKVRYIVTGEYGSKNARAHWHVILFFDHKHPEQVYSPDEIKHDEVIFPRYKNDPWARINWPHWEHGFSYFQPVDFKGMRYTLKYVLKDQQQSVATSHLAMSKKPPLGYNYFIALANTYIQQGLSPQSAEYTFSDQYDDNGKRRKFWLQGRMREIFLEYYIAAYEEYHGHEYPFSDFIENMEDKWVAEQKALSMTDAEWRNYLRGKDLEYLFEYQKVVGDGPQSDWENQRETHREAVSYLKLEGDMLLVRNSDGTSEILFGEKDTWLVETEDQLGRALGLALAKHREQAALPRHKHRQRDTDAARRKPRSLQGARTSRSGKRRDGKQNPPHAGAKATNTKTKDNG